MTSDKQASIFERSKLNRLLKSEKELFLEMHPKSAALYKKAQASLLGGVPMSWMMKWAGGFPIFVEEAHGATLTDIDGCSYADFCLGDTGAMAGHSPPAVMQYLSQQTARGITTMLPVEDAIWVGEELRRRFGLSYWQFALSATDANRFAIRLAREITQRPKILVFNRCYHGSVDETLIGVIDGKSSARKGNVGPPVDPSITTKVVEFNDVAALQQALAPRDVACVLTEPALTNIGIVLPEDGFHQALKLACKKTETLLIIDETHTISAGPAGYTGRHNLEPDILTVGKAIGSGVPCAAYGVSEEVAGRIFARTEADYVDAGGIGGTLAGNSFSIAAMRATLEHVLTDRAFEEMIGLGAEFTRAVKNVISETGVPWHVNSLGCRAEYRFTPAPPRNGSESAAASDEELEKYMHLYALNRGVLITPFHNMALVCPNTTQEQVDKHTRVFQDSIKSLTG